jgi:hypothetical protein
MVFFENWSDPPSTKVRIPSSGSCSYRVKNFRIGEMRQPLAVRRASIAGSYFRARGYTNSQNDGLWNRQGTTKRGHAMGGANPEEARHER